MKYNRLFWINILQGEGDSNLICEMLNDVTNIFDAKRETSYTDLEIFDVVTCFTLLVSEELSVRIDKILP